MLLLFLFLFIALFFSFMCSIMEAVLLSTPSSYLFVKEKNKVKWASQFLIFKKNIDKPLSAILSLNTIAHTVGAAGVGAQAIVVFGEAYFGIVSAILTLLILIVTEIIPKTIGAQKWKSLAGITVKLIKTTIIITYPLVYVSEMITKLISIRKNHQTTSREEISALASIGADEGIFNEREYKIIQNILKLKNIKVSEIMTPRTVVKIADELTTVSDFIKDQNFLHYSRIPIYSEKIDDITGFILRRTILENVQESPGNTTLSQFKRSIISVPDTESLFDVWEDMLDNKEHIALVVDQFGGFDGIVTMEDIIETILGLEIVDEYDNITDLQQYAAKLWKSKQQKYRMMKK